MPSFATLITRLRRICRNAARLLLRRAALPVVSSLPVASSPTKLNRQTPAPRKSFLRNLFLLLSLLLLLSAALLVLPNALQRSDQLPAPILPPTFNTDSDSTSSSSSASSSSTPLRVILVVQPFTPAFTGSHLAELITSLSSSAYDNESVHLHILLAPHHNASSFATAYTAASAVSWSHGRLSVDNATSGGLFEQVLSVWTPPPRARDNVLLVDAARAAPLSPQWYRYLKSARRRYHDNPDVAGFALEPVAVRRRIAPPIGGNTLARFFDEPVAEGGAGEDVFLYSNLPLVPAFSPASPAVWRAFTRWFLAYRAEWFLWPTVVSPRDKRDPSWDGYHGTQRAHWTLWFSRFCAQHALYTVYPRRARPAPLPPVGRVASLPPLLRFGSDGARPAQPSDDGDGSAADALARIVTLGRSQGGSVLLTVVNDAFLETARSWLCNVETAGFRPPGVVWITTDDAAYNALRDVRGSVAVRMASFRGATARTGTSYGTPGYWLLMLERTTLIRDVLDAGVGVFAFETDQIWLRDPVPFVRRVVRAGDEVDVVGTLDTRHEIGGNFLFLNPTLATRRLWREVARRFARAYREQRMAEHTARWKRYMENDQSILTKLIFYDATFKAGNPIVFRALDTDLFVDGRWYDKSHKFYRSQKSRSPIMVNNNFLIGIANKKARAIQYGHWFFTNGKCDAARVRAAISDNERRAHAGLEAAEPPAKQLQVGHAGPAVNRSNASSEENATTLAKRIEGGDVEAGLDAAVVAIVKEQVQ